MPIQEAFGAHGSSHPSAFRKVWARPLLYRMPFGSNWDVSPPPTQEVEEFSFITQLSGLTDHLPVAMRLMVSAGEEEA